MSDDHDAAASEAPTHQELPTKAKYKSFKKKFLKLRQKFNGQMRDSTAMFEEEQNAIRLARRLQEQNDQLLELLMEVNNSNRVPLRMHFDVRSPTPDASAVPALEPDRPTIPHRENTRDHGYKIQSEHSNEADTMVRSNSLAKLAAIPHTTLSTMAPEALPPVLKEDGPVSYLDQGHEDAFLSTIDDFTKTNLPESISSWPTRQPASIEKEKEREKEAQLRNPLSVYNWLRKHQPSVFLQDESSDKPPSKSAPKSSPKPVAPSRQSKRSSTIVKQESEVLDEEGFLVGPSTEATSRPKRKREDDAYRPKGGGARTSKRKRLSGANAT